MERRSRSSSSCLLEPKYSFCNDDDDDDKDDLQGREQSQTLTVSQEQRPPPLSVTVIHHEQLPTYSTERFYMLSEMEQKARSILFLSDFTDDNTATTTSSEDSLAVGGAAVGGAAVVPPANPFPSYFVLYVLWRPDNGNTSVTDFIDGYIEEPVKQLQTLAKREEDDNNDESSSHLPKIYVVVDTLVPDAAAEVLDSNNSEGREAGQDQQHLGDMARLQPAQLMGADDEDAEWPADWADASREFHLEEKRREQQQLEISHDEQTASIEFDHVKGSQPASSTPHVGAESGHGNDINEETAESTFNKESLTTPRSDASQSELACPQDGGSTTNEHERSRFNGKISEDSNDNQDVVADGGGTTDEQEHSASLNSKIDKTARDLSVSEGSNDNEEVVAGNAIAVDLPSDETGLPSRPSDVVLEPPEQNPVALRRSHSEDEWPKDWGGADDNDDVQLAAPTDETNLHADRNNGRERAPAVEGSSDQYRSGDSKRNLEGEEGCYNAEVHRRPFADEAQEKNGEPTHRDLQMSTLADGQKEENDQCRTERIQSKQEAGAADDRDEQLLSADSGDVDGIPRNLNIGNDSNKNENDGAPVADDAIMEKEGGHTRNTRLTSATTVGQNEEEQDTKLQSLSNDDAIDDDWPADWGVAEDEADAAAASSGSKPLRSDSEEDAADEGKQQKHCPNETKFANLSDVFKLNDLDTTDRTDVEESDSSAEEGNLATFEAFIDGADAKKAIVTSTVDDNDFNGHDEQADDTVGGSEKPPDSTLDADQKEPARQDDQVSGSLIDRPTTLVARHADSMSQLPIASNSPASRTGEPRQSQAANDSQESRSRRHETQMEIAVELAKKVSLSTTLRTGIEGITVGVVDHVRAAPGLEACLDAVTLGANARRRARSVADERERRSLIGIVCQRTEDMVGLSNGETDAVQGVFQSRVSAEWSGKGNLESFAKRAHENWCREHGVPLEAPVSPRNRRLNGLYRRTHPDGGDPANQLFAIIFIGCFAYLWMYIKNLNEQQ